MFLHCLAWIFLERLIVKTLFNKGNIVCPLNMHSCRNMDVLSTELRWIQTKYWPVASKYSISYLISQGLRFPVCAMDRANNFPGGKESQSGAMKL
jgi:hypothetical protein